LARHIGQTIPLGHFGAKAPHGFDQARVAKPKHPQSDQLNGWCPLVFHGFSHFSGTPKVALQRISVALA